jgi:hypothetical protein
MATANAPYIHVSSTKVRSGYDPIQARAQLDALRSWRYGHGVESFCESFLMILAKKELNLKIKARLIPFKLSRIQADLEDKAGERNITCKPRQIGSTTWHILCRLFMPAILNPGTSGLLISQTIAYGAQHFRILQRALKHFGMSPANIGQYGFTDAKKWADQLAQNLLHTQYSARHEIVFDFLDSKVLVDTAENKDAGTGLTLNYLVATELAYWERDPESLLSQAKEAVAAGGTIDYESTPNGMGGYFFEEWQRSKQPDAEFRNHFYPWWWQEEYEQKPATPVEDWSDEERKMAKEFAWTMEQVTWRRGKQKSLRARFPEKYPEDDQSCFLTSGDLFMDKEILRWLKMELHGKKPADSYQDGQVKIFKRRIKGRRYVIGADVAEGKLVATENADWHAAVVLDIDSGEQVALYKSRVPPEEYGQDLVDLAQMYNDAQIAIERNGPGGTVILAVQRQLLYGNIYYHKEWYKERKMVVPVAGYPTNLRTRPLALNRLAAAVRTAPQLIHSEEFVDEALTFVWRHSSKTKMGGKRVPQGAEGCHDDIVMAGGIAEYCRLVGLGYLDPVEVASERYGATGEETDEEAA